MVLVSTTLMLLGQSSGGALSLIESIITELRVPDLPYPVGRDVPDNTTRWRSVLFEAWEQASDARVVDHLKAEEETWTLRQVNAGYLADRIMSVFLRRSGLHPFLIHRAARIRFWLAMDLEHRGADAVGDESPLRRWLDSLELLQGWSRTGGRSDRWVLEHLGELEGGVTRALSQGDTSDLEACVSRWVQSLDQQARQARKVAERLWRTEQGAAGQRASENAVRAAIARSCRGRSLPPELQQFLEADWRQLMRHVALERGIASEEWRHAHRLLEWLVWVADPSLSDQDRNRLYHVGEQLTEKLSDLVERAEGVRPDASRFEAVDGLLVKRMRNEAVALEPVSVAEVDPRWLEPVTEEEKNEAARWTGSWYLRYEQGQEIRQFFFGFLKDTGEVLWTNAQGAKLALQPFIEVREMLETGALDHLPMGYSFGQVLKDTLSSLQRVLQSQRSQREKARARAQQEAEALRLQQERAREERERQEAERLEREEQERLEAEQNARDEEEARRRTEEAEQQRAILDRIDQLAAGAWIQVGSGEGARKLKLALRIGASGKLVFVDRFGLSREEIQREELMQWVLRGEATLLSEGAEFADTLSRVAGRLRVGR